MVKYLKSNDLVCREKYRLSRGATTEDMLDHIKLITRKNSDTFTIYTGTNDLTNGVKTINKVRNLVE